MRKIIFAVTLLASTHAFAQQIHFGNGMYNGNGYDDTQRMNEQNRQRWDQEEQNRYRVLQDNGRRNEDGF